MPRMIRTAPYFPVADVAKAAAAWGRDFGFAIDYIAGTPAEFAQIAVRIDS